MPPEKPLPQVIMFTDSITLEGLDLSAEIMKPFSTNPDFQTGGARRRGKHGHPTATTTSWRLLGCGSGTSQQQQQHPCGGGGAQFAVDG